MNQTTIKIRTANAKDANLLAELGRETFHDAFAGNPLMPKDDLRVYLDSAFSIPQVNSELNDPKTIFLLAEIKGEMIAYAKLECSVTTEGVTGKNPVKLKRLYVKQDVIGSGVGATLMKRCLEESAILNHDTIWLTVWKHNLIAQKFYRKWSFQTCGTFDFPLGNTVFIDKIMQRPVI